MTKQKQIEDYPELDKWCDDNLETVETISFVEGMYHGEAVEQKLLEQQAKVDSLTEQNREIESEYKELLWRNQKLEAFVAVVDYSGLAKTNQDIADTIELLNKESK